MADAKLSAPVGAPREGKGPKVANKAADVELVQDMLSANGYHVAKTGKVNAGLLKAIRAYQKNVLKDDTPDGIVDPGGQTLKKLTPKYKADQKIIEALEKKLNETMVYTIRHKGKELHIEEAEYLRIQDQTLKYLTDYTKIMQKSVERNERSLREIDDQLGMRQGIIKNITSAIILTVQDVKPPNVAPFVRAASHVKLLRSSIAAGDFAKIEKLMPRVEAALNESDDELIRFYRSFQGAASVTANSFGLASTAGFMIVGVLAAPAILASAAAAGATVTTGMAISVGAGTSGGLAVLETGSKELAKHAYGAKPNKSWKKSLKTVAIDGTIGTVTGAVGAKIGATFTDDIIKLSAPALSRSSSFLSKEAVARLLREHIRNAGPNLLNEIAAQTLKIVGGTLKSGKAPTEKELFEAGKSVLIGIATGSIMTSYGDAAKKLDKQGPALLKETLRGPVDKMLKSAKPKRPVSASDREEILDDMVLKLRTKAVQVGLERIAAEGKPGESPDQLVKRAKDAMANDSTLKKLTEKAVKEHLKKNGG